MEPSDRSLYTLSTEEVRILGSLVEKQLTTPDNYPLTLNSLLSACNQKTSREPVMSLDAATIEAGLQSLKEKGFVRSVSGAEHRVAKFKHDMPFMLRLSLAQTAVLTVLMLRGPQTVGELRSRTERMHSFGSIGEVAAALESMKDLNGRNLVMELERLPGMKEPRYAHLLSGEESANALISSFTADEEEPGLRDELTELRREVEELRSQVATLQDAFSEFRKQFE